MQKYISTCILNHRIETGSFSENERWWEAHQHRDIVNVTYDHDGNVVHVVRRGSM